MKQEFNVVIERDPESGWLVGEVAELPGCYTQGSSLAELEANIREAIAAYLETISDEDRSRSQFVGTIRIEVSA